MTGGDPPRPPNSSLCPAEGRRPAATTRPPSSQTQCGSSPRSGATRSSCGRSSSSWASPHSGHGPTASSSASCTSWATRQATYAAPSGHWSTHHRRSDEHVVDDRHACAPSPCRRPPDRAARGRVRRADSRSRHHCGHGGPDRRARSGLFGASCGATWSATRPTTSCTTWLRRWASPAAASRATTTTCPRGIRDRAIELGAQPVSGRELITRLRALRTTPAANRTDACTRRIAVTIGAMTVSALARCSGTCTPRTTPTESPASSCSSTWCSSTASPR